MSQWKICVFFEGSSAKISVIRGLRLQIEYLYLRILHKHIDEWHFLLVLLIHANLLGV